MQRQALNGAAMGLDLLGGLSFAGHGAPAGFSPQRGR